jgi:hypothetical protein
MQKQVNGSLSTENCYFLLSNLVANDFVDDLDAETVDPVQVDTVEEYSMQGKPGQANPVQADPEEACSVQADPEEDYSVQADPEEADPFQADPFQIESAQIEPVQMQVEVVLSAGIIKGFFAYYLQTFCSLFVL